MSTLFVNYIYSSRFKDMYLNSLGLGGNYIDIYELRIKLNSLNVFNIHIQLTYYLHIQLILLRVLSL